MFNKECSPVGKKNPKSPTRYKRTTNPIKRERIRRSGVLKKENHPNPPSSLPQMPNIIPRKDD